MCRFVSFFCLNLVIVIQIFVFSKVYLNDYDLVGTNFRMFPVLSNRDNNKIIRKSIMLFIIHDINYIITNKNKWGWPSYFYNIFSCKRAVNCKQ